jgi:hypothetical protein
MRIVAPGRNEAPMVTLFVLPTTRKTHTKKNGLSSEYRKVMTTNSCGYGVLTTSFEGVGNLNKGGAATTKKSNDPEPIMDAEPIRQFRPSPYRPIVEPPSARDAETTL